MKKYLPETAWILNIIGLVLLYTYDTWGANFVWYRFMGCMSILIGSAINTYIDFPQPFRAAKRSKKDRSYIQYLFHRDIRHLACIFTIHDAYGTVVGDITSHITI